MYGHSYYSGVADHYTSTGIKKSSQGVLGYWHGYWLVGYYMYIAECGYEHNISLAFLPLYPMLMRFIASTLLLMPVVGVAPLSGICST